MLKAGDNVVANRSVSVLHVGTDSVLRIREGDVGIVEKVDRSDDTTKFCCRVLTQYGTIYCSGCVWDLVTRE